MIHFFFFWFSTFCLLLLYLHRLFFFFFLLFHFFLIHLFLLLFLLHLYLFLLSFSSFLLKTRAGIITSDPVNTDRGCCKGWIGGGGVRSERPKSSCEAPFLWLVSATRHFGTPSVHRRHKVRLPRQNKSPPLVN